MILGDLVITGANGQRENLPTNRAYDIVINQNKHGFGSLVFKLRLPFAKVVQYLGNPQVLQVQFKRGIYVFQGRLEDIELNGNYTVFTALGYWRAFSDVKYINLWSSNQVKDWFALNKEYNAVLANRTPEKYAIDTNNRLFIGLTKNTTYTNGTDTGTLAFRAPQFSRSILGVQFNLEVKLPANWQFFVLTWPNDFSGSATAFNGVATGAVQTFATALNLNALAVANAAVSFDIINLTGANYNMAGETGTFYMKVTDVRVVSTDSATGRWINTTLTAARAAGVGVSAQVATSANMYVGQKLVIDSGLGPALSEIVTVLTIPDATHFTATFVNAHANGAQVSAVTCYPDQIASDILGFTRGFNPTHLSNNTALIQQSNFDLLNEIYNDANPSDILEYLAKTGDGTQEYEVGVLDNQQLFYRPKGNIARQWYIDYSDPQIKTSIDQLFNNVYATYQDLLHNDVRIGQTTDTTSIGRYGIQRQTNADLNTTNPTLATTKRNLTLSNFKTIVPQATIKIKRLLSTPNTPAQLVALRPNDLITIINLTAITQGTTLDRLRTFRVIEFTLNVSTGILTIVPEFILPSVDYQLANLLVFANRLPLDKSNSTTLSKFDRRQT